MCGPTFNRWNMANQNPRAKAIWEGLKYLHANFGCSMNLEVKAESLDLIRCLNNVEEDLSEIKILTEAIIKLAPNLGVFSF